MTTTEILTATALDHLQAARTALDTDDRKMFLGDAIEIAETIGLESKIARQIRNEAVWML